MSWLTHPVLPRKDEDMYQRKAFHCRSIYTAVTANLIDGYIIIEDNKILAVGTESETKQYITQNTEILDFSDKFIMPGIHDYHVHVMSGAMMEHYGDLRYADSEEDAAKFFMG